LLRETIQCDEVGDLVRLAIEEQLYPNNGKHPQFPLQSRCQIIVKNLIEYMDKLQDWERHYNVETLKLLAVNRLPTVAETSR